MPTTFPRPPRDLGRTDPDCTASYHGTRSAYTRAKCRCPEAREAKRLTQKRRRQQRAKPLLTDGTGTRRKLQALAAIGWRWEDLGERLAVKYATVQRRACGRYATVHVDTAARVDAVYNLLSMTPGPSKTTRARALAKGWAPPLAWDDSAIDDPSAEPNWGKPRTDVVDAVAIRRVMAGELQFGKLRGAEKTALLRQAGERYTVSEISQRLHASGKSVQKWRDRARAEVAA